MLDPLDSTLFFCISKTERRAYIFYFIFGSGIIKNHPRVAAAPIQRPEDNNFLTKEHFPMLKG